MIIFLDGQWILEEQARIPVTDRGFLLGDGAFATLQVREGMPLHLELHLQRLAKQARDLHIEPPEIRKEDVYETIDRNGAQSGIWRLKILITGGSDPALFLPKRKHGHVVMLLYPFTPSPNLPLRLERFPLPVSTAHSHFKSLSHLNRLYIMEYARERGYDDCVTTSEGVLLEAAFGNLCWVENGVLSTPDPKLPLNFGVTITTLVERAQRQWGWEVRYVRIAPEEIPQTAALFRTNTMSGIRPVASLQERLFTRDEGIEEVLVASSDLQKIRVYNFTDST